MRGPSFAGLSALLLISTAFVPAGAQDAPRCEDLPVPAEACDPPLPDCLDPAGGTLCPVPLPDCATTPAPPEACSPEGTARAKGREALLAGPLVVWTNWNMGSGSGLDADTLDGLSAGYFLDQIALEALARKTGDDAEAAARMAADEALAARIAKVESIALEIEGRVEGLESHVNDGNFVGATARLSGRATVGDLVASGPWLDARAHGAVPNDNLDDTAALQDAIDATPRGGTLLIPAGTYKISGDPALVFPNPIRVEAGGAVLDYGSGTGTAVKLGRSGPTYIVDVYVDGLTVKRTVKTGQPARDALKGVGILHSNIKAGRISDVTVIGFAKGLYVVGDDQGNAYNVFENPLLAANLHGIEIDTIDEGADGWSNENLFLGGRVMIYTGFTDYTDVKFIVIAKAENNHHTFIGMSLEDDNAERRLDVAGYANVFISNRFEGTNGVADIEFRPESRGNVVEHGYWGFGPERVIDNGRGNRVDMGSRVGYGTGSPNANLHVRDAARGSLIVEGGSTGAPALRATLELRSAEDYRGRGVLFTAGDEPEDWYAGVPYTGNGWMLARSASEPEHPSKALVFVTEGGNVGIGKTNPSSKLDVGGVLAADSASIRGVMRADGGLLTPRGLGVGTSSAPSLGLHVFNSGQGIARIEGGADGAPSWRTALYLTSDIDYRGRGVWMDTREAGTPAWFAGVPYTGDGYQIGLHPTLPEYKANAMLFIAESGNVGIATASPRSGLHVPDGRYAQLEDHNAGPPPAADCDSDSERGRISIDTASHRLYVCNGAARGWDWIELNP